MTASDDLFDSPAQSASGEWYPWKDCAGHVVIIKPTQIREGIELKFGAQDGVVLDLVDLDWKAAGKYADPNDDDYHPSEVFRGSLGIGGQFVDALKGNIGPGKKPVIAVIEMREPQKAGRQAYAALGQPDAAAMERAKAYYDAKGDPFAQTSFDAPAASAPADDRPAWER